MRLLQNRIEHRRQIARRGVDHLQHLGGRGLLFQRLALLGQQPRVLDRDHRLIGEGADQFDLPVGERLDPLARQTMTPIGSPSRNNGTPSDVRCYPRTRRPADIAWTASVQRRDLRPGGLRRPPGRRPWIPVGDGIPTVAIDRFIVRAVSEIRRPNGTSSSYARGRCTRLIGIAQAARRVATTVRTPAADRTSSG